MEIVFKLPLSKPPFMGIVFDNLRKACTMNEELVGNNIYHIKIESKELLTLDISLIGEEPPILRHYRDVSYDPERFEWFMRYTEGKKWFNFSHLIIEKDKHVVVKTIQQRRLFVVRVATYQVINSGF